MYQGDEIMAQKLDYSREDAMQILNNTNCSDEDKRSQYEEYMNNLKKTRKNAIVTKLNDLAREIPTITKDIYISVLKKYENDDLSIPFEVIESELSDFEKEMRKKYDEYLKSQKQEEIEEILPDVTKEEPVEKEEDSDNFEDTIFGAPKMEEEKDITEDTISKHLYTRNIPDPDLLIRTGGEMRVSNYLLWQIAYSEFIVLSKFWPEFDKDVLAECILEYKRRNRRFGK